MLLGDEMMVLCSCSQKVAETYDVKKEVGTDVTIVIYI